MTIYRAIIRVALPVLFTASYASNSFSQTAGGVVRTIAGHSVTGTGSELAKGDGGPATSANILDTEGLAVDSAGNVYLANPGHRAIRMVTSDGIIRTVAGCVSCPPGDNKPATSVELTSPTGVAVDAAGNIYISSPYSPVRKVTTDGVIHTIPGVSGENIAIDAVGNVYVADITFSRIRKVTPAGTVQIFVGDGTRGFSGDGGPATSARISTPTGIAVDAAGNVYFADAANNRIRKVTTDGIIRTVAGNGIAGFSGDGGPAVFAQISFPGGVALDADGSLYIAEWNQIRKVTTDGIIQTVAGNGIAGFSGDGGKAKSASFNDALSIAIDSAGNAYVSDYVNSRIRKVTFGIYPSDQPDFRGAGQSDILWYNAAKGETAAWLMDGLNTSNFSSLLTDPNWKVIGTPDLDGDGRSDLLWYNAAKGETAAWLMNGLNISSVATLRTDPNLKVIGTPDLDGDGKSDLLWYDAAKGETAAWLTNTPFSIFTPLLTDPDWKVIGTPDLDGDGKSDLLWYNAVKSETATWLMDGLNISSFASLLTDPNWKVSGTADLNGDGKSDLLWYNAAKGETATWLMNGTNILGFASLLVDPNSKVIRTADFNGDGKSDLLWYNAATGETSAWLMNGMEQSSSALLLTHPDWKPIATPDFDGNSKSDILWYNVTTGETATWLMDGTSISSFASLLSDPNWQTILNGK